ALWQMPIAHDATNAMITKEDKDNKEHAQHTDAGVGTSGGGAPCIAGKFHAALDTLFNMLSKTQAWYIFGINPNDSHLPNQLKGHAVKVQVRNIGLGAIVVQAVYGKPALR
ncbi:hypothetical protein J3A83DRAFT_4244433, partial [Scleroderma citrinum]